MLWYSCIIIAALVIYAVLLYSASLLGAGHSTSFSPTLRKLLYSLSFTVYGSGWIYLGTIENNTKELWSFLPLFIGPILVFIFFHRIFIKILAISHQENITSLAGFLEKRYGNSKLLAIIISIVCIVTFTPYIALQLKALIKLISVTFEYNNDYPNSYVNYITLSILLCLSFLIIVISARQENHTHNKYKSLLLIATTGAALKIIALISIAILACYLFYSTNYQPDITFSFYEIAKTLFLQKINFTELVLQTFIIMMVMVCIVYLFQTNITKDQNVKDIQTVRWVFSLYLLVLGICTVPIIVVGNMMSKDIGNAYWLIALPMHNNSMMLLFIVLLGGFAATIGTTIICCFSLSHIVITHLLLNDKSLSLTPNKLQNLRWFVIVSILFLAFICYLYISPQATLSEIGWVAFAGIVQLFPAMMGALYWKSVNKLGVIAGLLIGIGFWFYSLFLPLITQPHIAIKEDTLLAWLQYLMPIKVSYITFYTAFTLIINFVACIIFSLLSKKRIAEHWQATKFINQNSYINTSNSFVIRLEDLVLLVSRFLGDKRSLELFERFAKKQKVEFNLENKASSEWIDYTERLLAEKLGGSTARAMVKSAIEGHDMQMEDVLQIVDEASEVLKFNRSLLQGALEHITQGISVIDKSLQLVSWNQSYIDLFDYPEGLIQVGRPIADIIYYNAKRGMCGNEIPEEAVITRLKWLSLGSPHKSEHVFPNGKVIEIIGNPMPSGGFVTSFTDITAFRQAENELLEANELLEERVNDRTRKLSNANNELLTAKSFAEQANESKTRFLAAVSHDLMQPLNAARLFAASLSQEVLPATAKELINHLESSLYSAEELISDLLDISRLESGRITPKYETFVLNDLFDTLKVELAPLVPKDIIFKVHPCSVFIRSDRKLLRRIIQNFLTNAFRYGKHRVVLGARRINGHIRIDICDQGLGIPKDKQKVIFEEFKRLDSHQTRAEKGLGLGLAIADGFCKLLDYPITVHSILDKGSIFSVTVPIEKHPLMLNTTQLDDALNIDDVDYADTQTVTVLCVDNEESILIGMKTLLSRWGCIVKTAVDQAGCDEILAEGFKPQLLLIDYHLDDGHTGTQLIKYIREKLNQAELPAIIISADNTSEMLEHLNKENLDFIKKPIKPAQLRAIISLHVSLKQ